MSGKWILKSSSCIIVIGLLFSVTLILIVPLVPLFLCLGFCWSWLLWSSLFRLCAPSHHHSSQFGLMHCQPLSLSFWKHLLLLMKILLLFFLLKVFPVFMDSHLHHHLLSSLHLFLPLLFWNFYFVYMTDCFCFHSCTSS